MLPSERRLRDSVAQREANGQSLWTTELDTLVCRKLDAAWSRAHNSVGHDWGGQPEEVRKILALEAGWSLGNGLYPGEISRGWRPHQTLDLIGAVGAVYGTPFTELANEVFLLHRIAYVFLEGELISRSKDELNQSVVEEASRLLVGGRFRDANAAYMDSLRELTRGEAANSITDAARALELVLAELGADGSTLGERFKAAKATGLITSHDSLLQGVIDSAMRWVAAERGNHGDAHQQDRATVDDAWLMIHVVGALIVRIAGGTPRPNP